MPKSPKLHAKSCKKPLVWVWRRFAGYWRKNWWHKVVVVVIAVILLCLGTMYGIARWYIWTERNQPYTLGATFLADDATFLGVNLEQTFHALLGDLHIKHFRIVSYWSDVEPSPGHYDFSQLDWEFQQAQAAHAKITLVVGLRQPGWPECHPPTWVSTSAPENTWEPQLEQYMTAVINRYKHNPALAEYQVENEFFLKGFGDCTNFDRDRLVREYTLVRQLDPDHQIIIARSNNALGTPVGQPTPNQFSISIYRRVWDNTFTHRYLEYPFPSWYYAFLAGVTKLTTGKDTIVGEFQEEPWTPHGQTIPETSLAEQNKSLNAQRFSQSVQYLKGTGMKTAYLWGSEYWYYRLTVLHDPSVWNAAKQAFAVSNQTK